MQNPLTPLPEIFSKEPGGYPVIYLAPILSFVSESFQSIIAKNPDFQSLDGMEIVLPESRPYLLEGFILAQAHNSGDDIPAMGIFGQFYLNNVSNPSALGNAADSFIPPLAGSLYQTLNSHLALFPSVYFATAGDKITLQMSVDLNLPAIGTVTLVPYNAVLIATPLPFSI